MGGYNCTPDLLEVAVNAQSAKERLRAVLEPVVAATGHDLEELVVSPAGRRRLVRVIVDRDGGVSLDDIAEVSRVVSAELDAHDEVLQSAYVLEVTSPGVDRPLTEPRHWRRARGRLVRATRRDGGSVTGRVLEADASAVVLDVAGEKTSVPLHELSKGVVQVEFAHADEPGERSEGRA